MNSAPSSLDVSSLSEDALNNWPGAGIRNPKLGDATYLVYQPLAEQLLKEVQGHFGARRNLRVLDVGCGVKPFFPLVSPWTESYRGLDAVSGPRVDDVGDAQRMPYADKEFDLVICTQVLEHVASPDAVVSELGRVLKPGGMVLASTHGVFFYHPRPQDSVDDLWRWTHSGLRELFARNGAWQRLDVHPNRNMVACVGLLACVLLETRTRRRGFRTIGKLALIVLNFATAYLDDRFPRRARVPRGGSLSANYLVSAVR